jgi:hypothetical protein
MIMDAKTARVLVTLMAVSAAVGLVYAIRKTLVIFLFAILLAYFLDPAIAWVQRASPLSKQKRAPAIAQVYLALGIVVGAFILWAGPVLIAQVEVLGNNLPSLLDYLTTAVGCGFCSYRRGRNSRSGGCVSVYSGHGGNTNHLEVVAALFGIVSNLLSHSRINIQTWLLRSRRA